MRKRIAQYFFGGEGPIDLKSIQGKPIKHLEFMACRNLTDISAVAGMKLEDVNLWKTNIEDISPLAGMPLKRLNIEVVDSGKITDLTPLKGTKLKWLEFDANTVTKGIEIIRGMESLEEINRQTPGKFWKKYDSDAPARDRIRKLEIDYQSLNVSDDGSLGLYFYGDDIRDLSVLKGLPLNALGLAKSAIADLSPLEGTKITHLNLESTAVKDLSALKGISLTSLSLSCPEVDDISPIKDMPLDYLHLDCPKTRDLSALNGMPLKHLFITNTNVVDVSPLDGLPLEHLSVDIEHITKGISILKLMNSLKSINYCDGERFWEDYDAAQIKGKSQTETVDPNYSSAPLLNSDPPVRGSGD